MSLSYQEATESLSQLTQTERRSATAYGYHRSSAHFFIWAEVWALGYAGTYASPSDAGRIWLILVGIGMAGSFVLGLRADRDGRLSRANGLRFMGVMAITQGFIASVMLVIHGQGWEVGVLWPLLVGAVYAAVGLWTGLRYVVTGVALTGLTLVGFLYLPQYFCLWMAATGAGALVLGGIWMRRV